MKSLTLPFTWEYVTISFAILFNSIAIYLGITWSKDAFLLLFPINYMILMFESIEFKRDIRPDHLIGYCIKLKKHKQQSESKVDSK